MWIVNKLKDDIVALTKERDELRLRVRTLESVANSLGLGYYLKSGQSVNDFIIEHIRHIGIMIPLGIAQDRARFESVLSEFGLSIKEVGEDAKETEKK